MNFSYEQTTKIVFGRGKLDSIGAIASQYGKNVLLVTESVNSPLAPLYERVKGLLQQAGLTVHHYDGVVPNPTTESVDAGTQMARSEKVDAVIGIGGGSSMDTAKAVAMCRCHNRHEPAVRRIHEARRDPHRFRNNRRAP